MTKVKLLLKEPPLPENNTEVQQIIKEEGITHSQRPYPVEFGGCCGARILYKFPLVDRTTVDLDTWGKSQREALKTVTPFNEAQVSACVYIVLGVLEKLRKQYPLGYIMCTFNEVQIAQGWDKVMTQYFGFERLVLDFWNVNNKEPTSRVCLLGRNFHKDAKVS